MNRISIIGISGSGKSTFANNLGKILSRDVIHLDKYFLKENWQERYETKEEFDSVIKNLTEQEKWIIDGTYKRTLDFRLSKSDIIVYFDFPRWRCLWRAFVRILNRTQPPDKPDGVKNRIDYNFIKRSIFKYPKKDIESLLEKYKYKKIYRVRNNKEINNLLKNITNY